MFKFDNQSAWLAPSKPSSIWLPVWAGNLDLVLWMLQFENLISNVRSFQAFLDLASWVNKQPRSCALNVPSRGPNQHGWLLLSLPRSGLLSGQATLILRLECSNSKAQSAWLAASKPSSIWPPEWAGNLCPALWMFQIENLISAVSSFQAFLDQASCVGRQPWPCALNVPIRKPNQHGWLLPSLPRSGFLRKQATLILCFECSNLKT
jgi:hypothetical protein